MTQQHPITPPPPHLLKKFSAQAQDETKKRNGAGYLKTFATLCIEWAINCQSTSNDRQIRSSDIQPPPELVEQWWLNNNEVNCVDDLATRAAQWGADQELEACCEWLEKNTDYHITIEFLRDARRPKPPSLKEQALETLRSMQIDPVVINGVNIHADLMVKYDTIRRALEQLPDAL